MQTKSQSRRRLIASILVIFLSIGTYSRLTGTENVRLVIIVNLIAIGMGIGVFLTNFFAYVRADNSVNQNN